MVDEAKRADALRRIAAGGPYPSSAFYRTVPMEAGRTKARVECGGCGHVNYFWLWSLAGNGSARCRGCGLRILYRSRQTVPDGEIDRQRVEFPA